MGFFPLVLPLGSCPCLFWHDLSPSWGLHLHWCSSVGCCHPLLCLLLFACMALMPMFGPLVWVSLLITFSQFGVALLCALLLGFFPCTCACMMVASVFPCGVLCGFLLLALFSSGSGHWLWSQHFLDLRALPPFLHTCVFACSCFSGLWLTTTPLWTCRLSSIQGVWRRWVWVLFRWRADWIPVSVFPGFFPL